MTPDDHKDDSTEAQRVKMLAGLVRGLEWDKHPDADHDATCDEHFGGGQNNIAGQNEYAIYPHPCATGYFVLDVMGNRCNEEFSSVRLAKAAAEADYTARILAAIDTDAIAALVGAGQEARGDIAQGLSYLGFSPTLSQTIKRIDAALARLGGGE